VINKPPFQGGFASTRERIREHVKNCPAAQAANELPFPVFAKEKTMSDSTPVVPADEAPAVPVGTEPVVEPISELDALRALKDKVDTVVEIARTHGVGGSKTGEALMDLISHCGKLVVPSAPQDFDQNTGQKITPEEAAALRGA
jgi:hypothetical protein